MSFINDENTIAFNKAEQNILKLDDTICEAIKNNNFRIQIETLKQITTLEKLLKITKDRITNWS